MLARFQLGIYEKISALNSSVPESLEDFTSSMQKLETAFFKTAADLRNAMPEELQEELRVSVVKYRNLDFMVKGA